jgi:hypothetical protein
VIRRARTLQELTGLKSLQRLCVGIKVTDKGIAELKKAIPG